MAAERPSGTGHDTARVCAAEECFEGCAYNDAVCPLNLPADPPVAVPGPASVSPADTIRSIIGYARFMANVESVPEPTPDTVALADCDKADAARGWRGRHRMNVVLTDDQQRRFLAKFRVGDGCWEWQGRPWAGGYGRFGRAQGSCRAHRISYELFVGPIPDGLQLDHLCRNRACVRPDHLEPVTARENTLRGIGPAARNAVKTHCPKGHPYVEGNIKWQRKGRECLICNRAAQRARRLRIKQRLAASGSQMTDLRTHLLCRLLGHSWRIDYRRAQHSYRRRYLYCVRCLTERAHD